MKFKEFIKKNRIKLMMGIIVLCTALAVAFITPTISQKETADAETTTRVYGAKKFKDSLTDETDISITLSFNAVVNGSLISFQKITSDENYLKFTRTTGTVTIVYWKNQFRWTNNDYKDIFIESEQYINTSDALWLTNNTQVNTGLTYTGLKLNGTNAINSIKFTGDESFTLSATITTQYIKYAESTITLTGTVDKKENYTINSYSGLNCTIEKTNETKFTVTITKTQASTKTAIIQINATENETDPDPGPDPETKTISGSWTFKANPTFTNITETITQNVTFTTITNESYNSIKIYAEGIIIYQNESTEIAVYNNGTWTGTVPYQTVKFGKEEQEVSEEFYNFLTENAIAAESIYNIETGYWAYNSDIISPSKQISAEIAFTSNGTNFDQILINPTEIRYRVRQKNEYITIWTSAGGWVQGYSTLRITIMPSVEETFYNWFISNLYRYTDEIQDILNQAYEDGYKNGENDGYKDGYSDGENIGYSKGYTQGIADSGEYSFLSLLTSVIDAPVNVFIDMLDFEILGTNLATVIISILSVMLIVALISFFAGRKS